MIRRREFLLNFRTAFANFAGDFGETIPRDNVEHFSHKSW